MRVQTLAKRRMARVPMGTGQFSALRVIQDPGSSVIRGFLAGLSGQPGIRLAEPTGRRVYFGGGATPQRFAAPPSVINEENEIRAGRAINARRSLGRQRGRAPLGVPYAS